MVKALLAQDYTSGIFVRDDLGAIAGTLPHEQDRPEGRRAHPDARDRGELPLRNVGCDQPLFCAVTVTDGTLMQGQGHHGSFSRADTANFMAAIGPAFKIRLPE